VKEMVDAIAVNIKGAPYFDPSNRVPDHQEISHYCLSSVVLVSTESRDVLQAAYFSVKENLTSNRAERVLVPEFQKVTASAAIARVCLAYLIQFDHKPEPEDVLNEFPLAEYSATSWMSYAAVGDGEEDSLMVLIERFFCFLGPPYEVCYDIYKQDNLEVECFEFGVNPPASPLYCAALSGLQKTVEMLLERSRSKRAV
jgi:hypothetical protein